MSDGADAAIRGKRHRDDLPGPDDVAEPGLHRRLAAGRGRTGRITTSRKQAAWDAGRRDARPRRHPATPRSGPSSYPHEFSGGMRQRAMIAMAVCNDPDVIIADEPDHRARRHRAGADPGDARGDQGRATSAAIMLITHDLGVVAGMADQVLVMYAGSRRRVGHRRRRLLPPRMPYTVGLLGVDPAASTADGEPLTPIRGAPPSLHQPAARLPVLAPLPARPGGLPDETEPPLELDRVGRAPRPACLHWQEVAAVDDSADALHAP